MPPQSAPKRVTLFESRDSIVMCDESGGRLRGALFSAPRCVNAYNTNSTRFDTPNLSYVRRRDFLTVLSLMPSCSAISRLPMPSATRLTTSCDPALPEIVRVNLCLYGATRFARRLAHLRVLVASIRLGIAPSICAEQVDPPCFHGPRYKSLGNRRHCGRIGCLCLHTSVCECIQDKLDPV